jgi:hypothetical protein
VLPIPRTANSISTKGSWRRPIRSCARRCRWPKKRRVKAEVLFYLGLANYKMEKGQEAYNFFKACAAMKSPFQAQANKNLTVIRTQYHGIK